MSDEEIATLTTLSRSGIELASRLSRAQMLLEYRENPFSLHVDAIRCRVRTQHAIDKQDARVRSLKNNLRGRVDDR